MRGMSQENHVFHEDSRFPGRDLNPEIPHHEAVAWMNRSLFSGGGKLICSFLRTVFSSQAPLQWVLGSLFPVGKANGA
jgi:hypothetical protein